MAAQKTNITLAVESETINTIKQEAQTQNTSVNARVNRILNDYASLARYFTQKPIMLAPKIFEHLLDKVDEQVWLESWETTLYEITAQNFEVQNSRITIDHLVEHLVGNVGLKMGAFERFSFEGDAKTKYLVLTHKHGIKWSRILACAFSNLLEEKFRCKVEHEVSSNTVRLTIRQ